MRLTTIVVLAALCSTATADVIRGDVLTTRSRWSGEVIVTESDVRSPSGSVATVVQLGGRVGGIGMAFTHVPAPARVGDRIEIEVREGGVTRAKSAVGDYGLQRTTQSGTPLHRNNRYLSFIYDAAGTEQIPGLLELGALDDAFTTWMLATESCGGLRLHREIEPDVPDALDGQDTIHFRDTRWCRPATTTTPELCYPHEASAVTRVVFIDDANDPDDGEILEADMDINAVDFALAVDGFTTSDPRPALDLLSVATHEVGHVLGLAHDCATGELPWPGDASGNLVPSCDHADSAHVAATMYFQITPGDLAKRTLEDSDREAACEAVGNLPTVEPVTGGCSTTSAPGGLFVVVAALGAMRRRWRLLDGGVR